MPPKPNGFFMFMSVRQKEIKNRTNRAPTMREMPALCKDEWKQLSAADKARYDAMARQARNQNSDGHGFAKLDCHRHVIADRVDPVKEENKRRTLERNLLLNSFSGQEVKDIVFHVLDFQVMYDDVMEDQHFPLEIGMAAITLNSGIGNFMHRFIDPGEVPQGNRHLAVSHAENSHKIPLQFEHADGNIKALTSHMSAFVKDNSEGDEIPPVFCLQSHRRLVENCLDFIYNKVYVPEVDRFNRVYCLEDLVHCLIMAAGQKQASETQITDMLRQNRWDYNSSIRCFYHEELDCAFCSLSIVRRYSFGIFDTLSTLHDFKLTDKHMPDEMEQVYTVTESFGFGRQNARGASGDGRHNRSRYPSDNSSYADSYSSRNQPSHTDRGNAWHGHRERENAWQTPKVESVKALPSDEESEEEEEEVKPNVPEYSLGKLRLPKSLAQVQTQVGGLSVQDREERPTVPVAAAASAPAPVGITRGAWRGAPGGGGVAPIRPMGRGAAPPKMMGQVRPLGRAAASPVMPPPPPGFEHSISSQAPRPLSVVNDMDFPVLGGRGGRGRGVPRGRGVLPTR